MRGKHDWYSLYRNPRLLTVLASAIVVLLALFSSASIQLASLGLLSVAILHVLISPRRSDSLCGDLSWLQRPIALASDKAVFELYQQLSESLEQITRNTDPIYRDLALGRVNVLADELSEVAQGRIVFIGTETWRTAYARLLESPGLYRYRSIAYARSCTYWQDEPGRQSIELNFDLLRTGTLHVERIVILPDNLWPAGERFPIEPLNAWLHEQQTRGVQVGLVRKSALAGDPDLVVDLGIYGTRAVGFQEQDEEGKTMRFTLTFDFPEILAAESRWQRLSVYCVSYQNLLDQTTRPG